ncbi:dermal papilla-derived protein 6-like protein [Elysia marginata]|uniref:Elongator complex protein 5 n=1 Tax=Elysia marginata TaxID=1093978 RepID=A0AAV4HUW4_9GAST|nr:dermal papilla-derived protein 6-like protein [Elysia marginata]
MLEDLLRGHEKSRIVLISDSSDCNGRHFLLNWVESALERYDKLVLLCFERPPDFFLNWVEPRLRQKLVCVDGNGAVDETGEPTFSLDQVVADVANSQGTPTCVVVDSLSLPILMRPAPVTCRQLHLLANCEDFFASLSLRERFEYDETFHIEKISPLVTAQAIQKTPVIAPQEPDPTADLDLSFKLQLSESEREARSQVVLPYLKDGSTETSTSKILYEADDADDFDEEDPDDDLNI